MGGRARRSAIRLRIRVLPMLGGILGGVAVAVLAQQYGVAPLTLELLVKFALAGLAFSIIVPTLLYSLAAWTQGRRAEKMLGADPTRAGVHPELHRAGKRRGPN